MTTSAARSLRRATRTAAEDQCERPDGERGEPTPEEIRGHAGEIRGGENPAAREDANDPQDDERNGRGRMEADHGQSNSARGGDWSALTRPVTMSALA